MKSELTHTAVELLKQLISIPSFSKEENETAKVIANFFENRGIPVSRSGHNIMVRNQYYSEQKPTLLLNSHHDTIKPNSGYTKDPFQPLVEEGKLYGLGSNDAGGALVSLIATFLKFYDQADLPYNIILAATAEEEISGIGGIESILAELGDIVLAIVGEPTLMQMAIAEKGLLVLDCFAHGKTGHAARGEGENAIYKAMQDIHWFQHYSFDKVSKTLGSVNMNVTQIQAGAQHNVVPDTCNFVVDIRLTDAYRHEEILEIVEAHTLSEIKPRSTRLKPSGIDVNHPIVKIAKELNIQTYGSPTMSDQALMPFPSVKIGPGDSARSHTADEFIYLREIEEGIEGYGKLLKELEKRHFESLNVRFRYGV